MSQKKQGRQFIKKAAASSNGAVVYVPKAWIGKDVQVKLLE